MKNINKLTIRLLAVLTPASCNDFLDKMRNMPLILKQPSTANVAVALYKCLLQGASVFQSLQSVYVVGCLYRCGDSLVRRTGWYRRSGNQQQASNFITQSAVILMCISGVWLLLASYHHLAHRKRWLYVPLHE